MPRQPSISLRSPEATSLNRISAFYDTEGKPFFFDQLEALQTKDHDSGHRILNIDQKRDCGSKMLEADSKSDKLRTRFYNNSWSALMVHKSVLGERMSEEPLKECNNDSHDFRF